MLGFFVESISLISFPNSFERIKDMSPDRDGLLFYLIKFPFKKKAQLKKHLKLRDIYAADLIYHIYKDKIVVMKSRIISLPEGGLDLEEYIEINNFSPRGRVRP